MSTNIYHIKTKIISSLFWKLIERVGTQGMQVVIQVVLARILLPEDFGLIAIITVFISIANVFVQSGFNTALIQKKDAREVDFSSVFYLSLFAAGLLYLIIFSVSPLIADFYNNSQLISVIRVLAITLIFGAFNSVQNATVARNMVFKKLFISSIGAVVISGTAGIIAAYAEFGVWSLVVYQLTNQAAVTLILWFTVKWRPYLIFSYTRVKSLFSFGWKLLAASLLDTLYMQIRTLIIGRIYSPAMLGFYDRGNQFPNLVVSNINGSIQSVMLPALAAQQEDRKMVKDMMRRAVITSSFIVFPLMAGLAAVAEPAVKVILTDKWLPAVPFIQIFCAVYALWPIHTANLQAINALGRSDIFLKLEIIKKVLGLIILGISILFGIYAIAWGLVLSGVISSFINAYPNLKLLNYRYIEQMKDIMPSLIISLVMGAMVYSIRYFNFGVWQTLVIQIFTGITIYVSLAKLFKMECFSYLNATIKEIIKGKMTGRKGDGIRYLWE